MNLDPLINNNKHFVARITALSACTSANRNYRLHFTDNDKNHRNYENFCFYHLSLTIISFNNTTPPFGQDFKKFIGGLNDAVVC